MTAQSHRGRSCATTATAIGTLRAVRRFDPELSTGHLVERGPDESGRACYLPRERGTKEARTADLRKVTPKRVCARLFFSSGEVKARREMRVIWRGCGPQAGAPGAALTGEILSKTGEIRCVERSS